MYTFSHCSNHVYHGHSILVYKQNCIVLVEMPQPSTVRWIFVKTLFGFSTATESTIGRQKCTFFSHIWKLEHILQLPLCSKEAAHNANGNVCRLCVARKCKVKRSHTFGIVFTKRVHMHSALHEMENKMEQFVQDVICNRIDTNVLATLDHLSIGGLIPSLALCDAKLLIVNGASQMCRVCVSVCVCAYMRMCS